MIFSISHLLPTSTKCPNLYRESDKIIPRLMSINMVAGLNKKDSNCFLKPLLEGTHCKE